MTLLHEHNIVEESVLIAHAQLNNMMMAFLAGQAWLDCESNRNRTCKICTLDSTMRVCVCVCTCILCEYDASGTQCHNMHTYPCISVCTILSYTNIIYRWRVFALEIAQ